MTYFSYYDESHDTHNLLFGFHRGVPGDIYRYKNVLEVPSVFGFPIEIFPAHGHFDVHIGLLTSDFVDPILDYVQNHKRQGSSIKFFKECVL